MSQVLLDFTKQLSHGLQIREVSDPPLSAVAFRRDFRLGPQVVYIHRDRLRGPCQASTQEPNVLVVECIQTNTVHLTEPDDQCCWFGLPTGRCETRLEHLERGFVLQHPEGDRLIYHWLNGAAHAQA